MVVLAVLVAISILTVWRSARSARAMSAPVSDDKQIAELAPGTISKIVVQIEQMPAAGTVRATVLDKRTEEIYQRSKVLLHLYYSPKVKIVMGKAADLHVGAVVHVTGMMRDDRSIEVEQFVILTGYVKIE